MFEKGIRGGITQAVKRHAKAVKRHAEHISSVRWYKQRLRMVSN